MTKPAKPASDAAEIARKLREDCIGMEDCKPGNAHEFCFTCQAADTIEALQRENERLAKALTYISWVGPALVAPGGVLWIRQDSVDALLLDAGIMPHRPLTGESEDDYYRRVRGEGDQLQGGENLSERFERLAADPGLEERSRRVRDGIREASKVNPYTADELAAINNQHPWGDCNDSNQSCRLLATALKLQRELTNLQGGSDK